MPSIITKVWPVLAPRSRMFVVEPGPPLSVTSTPGTVRNTSTSDPGLLVASVSPLITPIELPVRLMGSGSLSAVTTTSAVVGSMRGGVRGRPRLGPPRGDLDLCEFDGPAWAEGPD